ncbi:MAG: hypothetical protein JXA81_00075, partial [Sedimentisphaerales bacterium]|nr:hypothetical protein [Sedimentisphaerales bacterium]
MKKHHGSESPKSEVAISRRVCGSTFSPQDTLRCCTRCNMRSEPRVQKNRFAHPTLLFSVFCLLLFFFAGMISGCASSAKDAPSMQVAGFTNDSAEEIDTGDFDLLEEEYAEQMVEVPDPLEPFNR